MAQTVPLTVKNVKKSFGDVHAVRGVSFSVQPGEVLGIVGPNGAGKTTTIKMILGLLEPDSGSVSLFGKSITDPSVRARIGYMPEHPSFYRHLTGRELVLFAASLFSLPRDEAQQRTASLLKTVGLDKAANRPLREYSKGMLQRVCLAQALVNNPDLIFLDEPLDGLDPLGRIRMREILNDIKASGTAIVFNSHILSDVEMVASHIAIMAEGKLAAHGTVKSVVAKGKTLEEVFLAAVGTKGTS